MTDIVVFNYENYVLYRLEGNKEMTPDEWRNFVFWDPITKVKLRHQFFGWDLYTSAEINTDKDLDYLKRPEMLLCFIMDGCNPDPDDIMCPTVELNGTCYYYKKFDTETQAKDVAAAIRVAVDKYLKQCRNKKTNKQQKPALNNRQVDDCIFADTQFYKKLVGKVSGRCAKEYINSMQIPIVLKTTNNIDEIYSALCTANVDIVLRQKKIGQATLLRWLKEFADELVQKSK